jgi:phosphomannomutase
LRPVVLFDMDGTLTPVRKKIESNVINSLIDLSKYSDIGIVTGSGMDYLVDQCASLWDKSTEFNPNMLSLFPCNGTKSYEWSSVSGSWNMTSCQNMSNHMGEESFKSLIKILLKLQNNIATSKKFEDVPMIGHFISYRGSMINWCPMGRDANFTYRKDFVKIDKSKNIRSDLVLMLDSEMIDSKILKITAALGGNTSIDIYPDGWDKTFSLNHVLSKNIWFVGDRCKPGENDYELFKKIEKTGQAFETKSTTDTIRIINDLIMPNLVLG